MFRQLIASSLGRKYIMAITGAMLLAFVAVHMLGNWQFFLGAQQINAYAHLLKSKWMVLWAFRLVLLLLALTHISVGIWLFLDNRRARPVGYGVEKTQKAGLASRTMIYSGLLILAFVVYHLLHYTVQWFDPEFAAFAGRIPGVDEAVPDVHRMMSQGFSQPGIPLGYILAVALLAWHLSHGVSSLFQTLGCRNDAVARCLDRFGWLVALLIFCGLTLIPLAIYAAAQGWIPMR